MGVGNRQVAIAIGVILIAVGYVLVTGISDTMVYYYTVSEVAEQQQNDELGTKALRVAGNVVPGTIETDSTGLYHKFVIEEGGEKMSVVYRDIVPDTFQDNAEAVVEGRFDEHGTFEATFLMAKCPSKYEAQKDWEQYRGSGVAAPAQGQ